MLKDKMVDMEGVKIAPLFFNKYGDRSVQALNKKLI